MDKKDFKNLKRNGKPIGNDILPNTATTSITLLATTAIVLQLKTENDSL